MKTGAVLGLFFAIILLGSFTISWLVFENLMVTDWFVLAMGVLNLAYFILQVKTGKR